MKKILISCGVAISILIIIATATEASNGGTIDFLKKKTEQGELIMSGDLIKSIKDSTEYNTSFDDLPTYPYDDFMFQVPYRKPSSCEKTIPMSSFGMSDLFSFNDLFPIKRISIINDDCVCVEYKLNKDGHDIHAFLVFERDEGITESKERFESWAYYGELYFAYPELKAENLTVLKGEQKLESLPFRMELSKSVYIIDATEQQSLHAEETIMTRDGFVIIDYNADAPDGKNVQISNISVIKFGESSKKYPNNSLIINSFTPEYAK